MRKISAMVVAMVLGLPLFGGTANAGPGSSIALPSHGNMVQSVDHRGWGYGHGWRGGWGPRWRDGWRGAGWHEGWRGPGWRPGWLWRPWPLIAPAPYYAPAPYPYYSSYYYDEAPPPAPRYHEPAPDYAPLK